MKRLFLAASLMLFALISEVVIAQTIVENPAKPDNPRAGRVVTLEEVMRIEDTGEDFFIKNVMELAVSSDGSVFVQDEQKQLLQFDSRGRFVRNLLKIGQGPGELTIIWDFIVKDRRVYLLGNPPKLLILDFAGSVLKEIGLHSIVRCPEKMIASTTQGFLMYRRGRPDSKAGIGWKDMPEEIVAVSPRGENLEVIGSFATTPAHIEAMPGGVKSWKVSVSLLFAAIDDGFIALSHTSEYLVKVFDIKTRKVKTAFKRPYKRISRPDGGGGLRTTGGSSYTPPQFLNDISWIHSVGGQIWVQTSAADVKRGILFDIYDLEGHYLDCFFLKRKEGELSPYESRRFVFSGGFVYFDDRTEDDLVVIRKCRLIGL